MLRSEIKFGQWVTWQPSNPDASPRTGRLVALTDNLAHIVVRVDEGGRPDWVEVKLDWLTPVPQDLPEGLHWDGRAIADAQGVPWVLVGFGGQGDPESWRESIVQLICDALGVEANVHA